MVTNILIYLLFFANLVQQYHLHPLAQRLNLSNWAIYRDSSYESLRMRWINPHLKSSLLGMLSGGEVTSAVLQNRTENIRQIMLNELGEFGEKHYPKIALRVRYAQDAQGLWYARGDVMAVLSAMQGEVIARQKVGSITKMFEGLLPGSLGSRRSSLTV